MNREDRENRFHRIVEVVQSVLKNSPAQKACVCRQVGEKAVKAVHYGRRARFVSEHSVYRLLKEVEDCIPADRLILETAGTLDQYCIPARYPNGLPDGDSLEVYTRKQTRNALGVTGRILEFASLMPGGLETL
jgi:HEPN domain-containing protein